MLFVVLELINMEAYYAVIIEGLSYGKNPSGFTTINNYLKLKSLFLVIINILR